MIDIERSIYQPIKPFSATMDILKKVAVWLLIIGGLNWLLVAFGYNLVDSLVGEGSSLAMIIYVLVGLSAVYKAAMMVMPRN